MTTESEEGDRPAHLRKVRLIAQRLIDILGPAALDRARHLERVSQSRIIARSVRVEIERILKKST